MDVVGGDQAERGPINTHPILGKYLVNKFTRNLAVIHQQETYERYESCGKSGSGDLHAAFTHCSSTWRLLSRNG